MSKVDEMAVQSFCFRGFKDVKVVAEKVLEIGLDAVELCGVHVDFLDEAGFEGAIAAFRDAGVRIVSIGVQRFKGDAAQEEKFFRFAEMAGAATISADFDPATVPESLRAAEELGEKYNIDLAIHNHGGRHWLGSTQMLGAVLSRGTCRPRR